MFTNVKTPMTLSKLIWTPSGRINTVRFAKDGSDQDTRPPILLLHGWGGGVGWWAPNVDALAEDFTVYAIDGIGWGRSDRPPPPSHEASGVTAWWVRSVDEWREAMNLERFTLVGHSAGAYVACSYALQHPQ